MSLLNVYAVEEVKETSIGAEGLTVIALICLLHIRASRSVIPRSDRIIESFVRLYQPLY